MPKFERPITLDDLREGGPVPPPRRVLPQRPIITADEQAEHDRWVSERVKARHQQNLRHLQGVYADARHSGMSVQQARKVAIQSLGYETKSLEYGRRR